MENAREELKKLLKPMLNLKHLYYFHEFAHDFSTSKAAKRLGITAPALSNQLKHLETFLGLPLTRRTGAVVKVTELGEIVLQYTAQMFSAYEALKYKITHSQLRNANELRVGTSHNLGPSLSFDLLALVEKTRMAEAKSVHVTSDTADKLVVGLLEGKFDLVIGAFSALQHVSENLYIQRLAFPVRIFTTHDLFGKNPFGGRSMNSVTLAEVVTLANSKNIPIVLPERSSVLREEIDSALSAAKCIAVRTIECNGSGVIAQLIERGLAYGLTPTTSLLDFRCAKTLAVLGPKQGYWTHTVSVLSGKATDLRHPYHVR